MGRSVPLLALLGVTLFVAVVVCVVPIIVLLTIRQNECTASCRSSMGSLMSDALSLAEAVRNTGITTGTATADSLGSSLILGVSRLASRSFADFFRTSGAVGRVVADEMYRVHVSRVGVGRLMSTVNDVYAAHPRSAISQAVFSKRRIVCFSIFGGDAHLVPPQIMPSRTSKGLRTFTMAAFIVCDTPEASDAGFVPPNSGLAVAMASYPAVATPAQLANITGGLLRVTQAYNGSLSASTYGAVQAWDFGFTGLVGFVPPESATGAPTWGRYNIIPGSDDIVSVIFPVTTVTKSSLMFSDMQRTIPSGSFMLSSPYTLAVVAGMSTIFPIMPARVATDFSDHDGGRVGYFQQDMSIRNVSDLARMAARSTPYPLSVLVVDTAGELLDNVGVVIVATSGAGPAFRVINGSARLMSPRTSPDETVRRLDAIIGNWNTAPLDTVIPAADIALVVARYPGMAWGAWDTQRVAVALPADAIFHDVRAAAAALAADLDAATARLVALGAAAEAEMERRGSNWIVVMVVVAVVGALFALAAVLALLWLIAARIRVLCEAQVAVESFDTACALELLTNGAVDSAAAVPPHQGDEGDGGLYLDTQGVCASRVVEVATLAAGFVLAVAKLEEYRRFLPSSLTDDHTAAAAAADPAADADHHHHHHRGGGGGVGEGSMGERPSTSGGGGGARRGSVGSASSHSVPSDGASAAAAFAGAPLPKSKHRPGSGGTQKHGRTIRRARPPSASVRSGSTGSHCTGAGEGLLSGGGLEVRRGGWVVVYARLAPATGRDGDAAASAVGYSSGDAAWVGRMLSSVSDTARRVAPGCDITPLITFASGVGCAVSLNTTAPTSQAADKALSIACDLRAAVGWMAADGAATVGVGVSLGPSEVGSVGTTNARWVRVASSAFLRAAAAAAAAARACEGGVVRVFADDAAVRAESGAYDLRTAAAMRSEPPTGAAASSSPRPVAMRSPRAGAAESVVRTLPAGVWVVVEVMGRRADGASPDSWMYETAALAGDGGGSDPQHAALDAAVVELACARDDAPLEAAVVEAMAKYAAARGDGDVVARAVNAAVRAGVHDWGTVFAEVSARHTFE